MYLPKVVQVIAQDDYKIVVYFEDGKIVSYDMTPVIKRGGVFAALSSPDVFKKSCTVLGDTVAWDLQGNFDATQCIDIDPMVLYEEGLAIEDPLGEAI